ncbi:MAG: hypothetical protein H7A25_07210 [Leptospiraceae bacterium]|nr:hypothetical protein [Leptospiraceae bacterium]MCP5499672.1 hypothetical protein [Leptospiraceae bacterium]
MKKTGTKSIFWIAFILIAILNCKGKKGSFKEYCFGAFGNPVFYTEPGNKGKYKKMGCMQGEIMETFQEYSDPNRIEKKASWKYASCGRFEGWIETNDLFCSKDRAYLEESWKLGKLFDERYQRPRGYDFDGKILMINLNIREHVFSLSMSKFDISFREYQIIQKDTWRVQNKTESLLLQYKPGGIISFTVEKDPNNKLSFLNGRELQGK